MPKGEPRARTGRSRASSTSGRARVSAPTIPSCSFRHRPDPSCTHRASRRAVAAGTERAGQLVGGAERDGATSAPPGGCLIAETMEALHDVVKAGKARYIGASSMFAWQFAKLQHAAELHGWATLVEIQDQYNLLKREEEREMLPMCADMGVGCVPYSPLAKGRLTRPWGEHTHRSDNDAVAGTFDLDIDRPVVEAVQRVAQARGVPMAQGALAWLLTKPS